MTAACTVAVLLGETLRPPSLLLTVANILLMNQPDIVASRRNALQMFAGITLGFAAGVVALAAFGDKPWFLVPTQFAVFFFSLLLFRASTAPMAALQFGIVFAFGVPEFVPADPLRPILWSWFMAIAGIVLGLGVQMIPRPDDPEDALLDDMAERLRLAADGLDLVISGAGPAGGLTTLATLENQVRLAVNFRARDLFLQRRENEQARLTIAVQRLVAGVRWLGPEADALRSGGRLPTPLTAHLEGVRDFCRRASRALEERRPLDDVGAGLLPVPAPQASGATGLAATLAQLDEARATAADALAVFGRARASGPAGTPERTPFLLGPDALTDPDAIRFALKGAIAGLLGTILYEATGWGERATNQFLIFVMSAQARAIGASVRDTILRLAGTVVGLAAAFAVILAGFPSMRGVATLLAVSAPVFFAAAWVQRSVRFAIAGIYIAINYALVAFARTNDLPDPQAGLARTRALLLAIGIVFAVGALLWPAFASAGRGNALSRALRPLASAFRLLPSGAPGLPALRDSVAATQARLLDFLGLLELVELEPARGRSPGERSERAWLAAATPVQSLLLGVTTRSIRQQEASPPSAAIADAERRVCDGFATSLEATAARLAGAGTGGVSAPLPLAALAAEPAILEPYAQMADSLARLDAAIAEAGADRVSRAAGATGPARPRRA